MTDKSELKTFLTKLRKNLNILQEREARHAGNAPLELLNQIEDHRTAIELTEQAKRGELSEAEWREALKPLLISLEKAQTYIDQSGQTVQGDQYNVAGDQHIHHYGPEKTIPLQRPPRAQYFTDRKKELAQLLEDLHPRKVATLCGPGGIGKTALATEAIWTLAPDDGPPERFPDGIIFHSFYNQPQADIALEQIARVFGEEPKPTPQAAAQRALAGRQALLVLDGAEDADDLPAVRQVAGSCGVLITSRQRKDAVAERQDIKRLDQDNAVDLLRAWAKDRIEAQEVAEEICERVSGLPLAVRLVGRYLAETGETAGMYLEWLKEAPFAALDPDEEEHRLQSVTWLLDRSMDQVGKETHQVLGVIGMLALAPFGLEVIGEVLKLPPRALRTPLRQLTNYGLLLGDGKRYEVSHALIYTYARERLHVSNELVDRLVDYYHTLTRTESVKGVTGYKRLALERPHLMRLLADCTEREEWATIDRLAQVLTDENSFLKMQGYWIDLVVTLETGLQAAQKLNNRHNEGAYLGDLGRAYRDLWQTEKAIGYIEQALTIAQEMGHRRNECLWVGYLGTAYRDLGQVEKAISYYEQALIINQEIDDQRGKGARLFNLGLAYHALKQVEKAISYYEQALTIAQEVSHRQDEGNALCFLGAAYRDLGQVEKAISYCEQALTIAQEIGYRRGKGNALSNLGLAYQDLGQVEKAISYYERALIIDQEVGHRRGEAVDLGNLGRAYHALGQVEQAIDYYQQALHILEEIKSPKADLVRQWLDELDK